MAKKSHSFDELSDKRCTCGKRIKQRLIEAKEPHNINRCYGCFVRDKKAEQHSKSRKVA